MAATCAVAICVLAGCLGTFGSPPPTGRLVVADLAQAYSPPAAGSVVAARNGGVWISEGNGRVARADRDGRMSEAALARGTDAVALTAAHDGSLWYASDDVLGRVAASGAVRIYGLPAGVRPRAIAEGSDGSLWFATDDDVGRLNRWSGQVAMLGHWPGRFRPAGIAAGPGATIWVTDAGNDAVVRLDGATRTIYRIPVPDCGPADIVLGDDANMWFAESNVDGLGRITPSGTFKQFRLDSPTDSVIDPKARVAAGHIAAGGDGIWVSEAFNGSVLRLAYTGKQIHFRVPAAFSQPASIAVSGDGAAWFAQSGDPRAVARIDSKGKFAEFALPIAVSSIDAFVPTDIVASVGGSLWLIDAHRAGILKPDGTFATLAAFADAGIASAAAAPNGDLWVAEFEKSAVARLARVAPDGSIHEATASMPDTQPSELAVTPDGTVWSFERGSRNIRELTPDGTFSQYTLTLPKTAQIEQIVARPDGGASIVVEDPNVYGKLELEVIDSRGVVSGVSRFAAIWNDPAILSAPDGTIWYEDEVPDTAHPGNFIPALTSRAPGGALHRYPMPWSDIPLGIGRDGSVWFPTSGAESVGHLRTDGRFEEFALPPAMPPPFRFAGGAGGDMWFVYQADLRQVNGPTLGELSRDGKITEYRVR
jgi:virginiamycin B lyase